MSDSPTSRIEGAAGLERLFGGWPTFRGAAIVYLRLDRGSPTLTGAFELTEPALDRLTERVNVTLRWYGVTEFSLSGLDACPALDGLHVSASGGTLVSKLHGDEGLRGTVVAERIRVLDVAVVQA